jgi:exopolysaccharide biosynthesis polyprenyl glycosylphosphotransferase
MAGSSLIKKRNPWQLRLGERRAVLLLGDLIMASISMLLALYLWGQSERFMGFGAEFLTKRVPAWFYLLPLVWMLLLIELYDIHRAADWQKTVRGIAVAGLVGLGLYLLLYFYYVDPPRNLLPRLGVATFMIAAGALTLTWRLIYIRLFTLPALMRRVLVVGGGKTGRILLQIVNRLNAPPFHVIGIIDDDPAKRGLNIEGAPVLGSSDELLKIVEVANITDMVVAISGEMQGCMFQALLDAQESGVEIIRMPVMYEELLGRVPIRLLDSDWILTAFVDHTRVSAFYELTKRLIDLMGGLVGGLGLLAVLPFVALAVLLDDGWPIFYGQTRSGRGGQPYQIYKFRTMRRDAEANGKPQWAKEDDERATRIGKILRRTHLDELPQFVNVLSGEMSLVGPRAERPELVTMFQGHVPFYRSRLLVKPGITGWAQVNSGYAATIDETITKLEFDLYYIKHRNIILDIEILLRTPPTMLGLRGR